MTSTKVAYVDSSTTNTYGVLVVATKAADTGWPTGATLAIGSLVCCAWSPDGSRLAIGGSTTPFLKVIDVATKTVEAGWPTPPGVCRSLAWSPDGTRLVSFGDTAPNLKVIDVASKSFEVGWPAASTGPQDNGSKQISWRPDGAKFVLATQAGAGYDVLDVATKTIETGWPTVTQNNADAVDFSPDGTRLAVISGAGINQRLYVIVVATKTTEAGWPTYTAASQSPRGVSWSPDGTRLAVARVGSSGVNQLQVINVASKTEEASWPAGSTSIQSLRFSPDGLYLSVGYSISPIHEIVTVATKADYAPPFTGSPPGTAVADVAWSPNLPSSFWHVGMVL